MPFIPHTDDDTRQMLQAIGVQQLQDLFLEIPSELLQAEPAASTSTMHERKITQHIQQAEAQLPRLDNFIGAGAYQHFIPAAVWQIVSRGEFLTAYTPYQPEASQGSLQLIYEFQTAMTRLLALEVSNASLYDGATALVEACMMAIRLGRGRCGKILLPTTLPPQVQQVVTTFCAMQQIDLLTVALDPQRGVIDQAAYAALLRQPEQIAAVVIAQPTFFGALESVDMLTDLAHQAGVMVLAYVNPLAMAWLKPPGQWGAKGVDIACGEAQPLGMPLSLGGPYAGFLCCREEYVRQLPGRLVGRTNDSEGKEGYTLTLQAREQHIRRGKAKSNICTNQGLLVVAATVHMSLLGAKGLAEMAQLSHLRARQLRAACAGIDGVRILPTELFFHEFVLQFDLDVVALRDAMEQVGIAAGAIIDDPTANDRKALLVCATDMTTPAMIERYVSRLEDCMRRMQHAVDSAS